MPKRDHDASQLGTCECSQCLSRLERFTAAAQSVIADGDSSPTSSPHDPSGCSDPDSKEFDEVGSEKDIKSLQDLLGSDSRDFLLDRDLNTVLISKLEDYDFVGLFAYTGTGTSAGIDPFRKRLAEIYNKKNGGGTKSFEIVFIDLMNYSSYSDEDKIFLPWLTLPPGDEKTLILSNMFTGNLYLGLEAGVEYGPENHPHPLLFIKPKGEARLELYGYYIIDRFGEAAYPFTEQALARMAMNKLQYWNLDSFVEQARQFGFDFNRLVRHKTEKEVVTLSSIKERHKVIILMFASFHNEETTKALDCLTDAYGKPNESSFEVIFVNSVSDDFSNIPWLTLEKEPGYAEVDWNSFSEKTGDVLCFSQNCFVTFAPDGTLLGAGLVEVFENRDFPFIREGELMKHLGLSAYLSHKWWMFDFDCFHWLRLKG